MGYKQEFIEFMARSNVLMFGDFTTKSGRKSPYFINTGNYRTGEQAAKLGSYYAACIRENVPGRVDMVFGPAYKGIQLAIATTISLYNEHKTDIAYCFNRKEAKDHGEGGMLIGHKPKNGDRVVIVEDVTSAGTSIRECVPLLKEAADVEIAALIVSVDRLERGTGEKTAIQELRENFGVQVYPIVTVLDILEHLYNKEVDGKVYIDGEMKRSIENYLEQYMAKGVSL